MEVARFDNKKISLIKIHNNGLDINIEVGKNTDVNDEVVIAILYEPYRKLFHICTQSRGVIRGKSIRVFEINIIELEYFDVD